MTKYKLTSETIDEPFKDHEWAIINRENGKINRFVTNNRIYTTKYDPIGKLLIRRVGTARQVLVLRASYAVDKPSDMTNEWIEAFIHDQQSRPQPFFSIPLAETKTAIEVLKDYRSSVNTIPALFALTKGIPVS